MMNEMDRRALRGAFEGVKSGTEFRILLSLEGIEELGGPRRDIFVFKRREQGCISGEPVFMGRLKTSDRELGVRINDDRVIRVAPF